MSDKKGSTGHVVGNSAKKDRAVTLEAPKLAKKLDKLWKPRVAA